MKKRFSSAGRARWTAAFAATALAGASLPAAGQFEESQQLASGSAVGAFGSSVAFDAPGRFLLVGDPLDEPSGPASGSATLLVRNGASWFPVSRIEPVAGFATEQFGAAVAVDATADNLLIGSPTAFVNSAAMGAAYVFTRSGGQWIQAARLLHPAGMPGDDLGAAVALSPAGNVAAVGAPGDGNGKVLVFGFDGLAWLHQFTLTPIGGSPAGFGRALAFDSTGTLLAIGAPDGSTGRVYLYRDAGGGWGFDTSFAPQNLEGGDGFGSALDFDPSDIVLMVGIQNAQNTNGAVSVCTQGAVWSETQRLSASDAASGAFFGSALAVDPNGQRLVIGAPGKGAGSAYLFEHDGSAWNEQGLLASATASGGDAAGSAVAAAGGRFAIGAPGDGSSGSVSIFSPAIVLYCTAKTSSAGCQPSVVVSGAPSASDAEAFTVAATDVVSKKAGFCFYGTSGGAALPAFGGTICVLPPLRRQGLLYSAGNAQPDCSGVLTQDFNATIQSGTDALLAPGMRVNLQFWYRDPAHSDGIGVGLSSAIELEILP